MSASNPQEWDEWEKIREEFIGYRKVIGGEDLCNSVTDLAYLILDKFYGPRHNGYEGGLPGALLAASLVAAFELLRGLLPTRDADNFPPRDYPPALWLLHALSAEQVRQMAEKLRQGYEANFREKCWRKETTFGFLRGDLGDVVYAHLDRWEEFRENGGDVMRRLSKPQKSA